MPLGLWSRVVEPLALRLPIALVPSRPVVVIGFAKSGKSLVSRSLHRSGAFSRYPTEGNLRLFMRGIYPWHASTFEGPPMWVDPTPTKAYVSALYAGPHGRRIRGALGLYEAVTRKPVVVDNGNLTYWLEDFLKLFPDARLVSLVRDPYEVVPEVARKLERKCREHRRLREYLGTRDQLLETLTRHWFDAWRIIRDLEARQGTMVVRFEELRANPTEVLGDLSERLGHGEAEGFLACDWARRPDRPSGKSGEIETPKLVESILESLAEGPELELLRPGRRKTF